MSEKREFPILNGKLLSDLDANGHKIIGIDIEVPPEKIKEAVAPELKAKADNTALAAEVSRAKGAEAVLDGRVKELEENPSIIADDALTKDGENPVKSKGIWSAIWGAIAAPAASVYAWVTTELGKKQNTLSTAQLNAVNSGITTAKVTKLDGIEEGAQKNPDLSGYAKKTDIPAAPNLTPYAKTADVKTALAKKQNKLKQGDNITIGEDGTISASGGSVDVVAEIAGKEIKPSGVVIEVPDGEGGVYHRLILDGLSATFEDFEFGDGMPRSIGWSDLVFVAKKYDFHECETEEYTSGGISRAEVNAHPFKINHFSTDSYSGAIRNITLWLLKDEGNISNDFILVFDCYDEGYRIEWTEEGREYTFHPRGGDAANLEVVAGKRNVFFITEVQPNVFMVARDELALPDAGGGE